MVLCWGNDFTVLDVCWEQGSLCYADGDTSSYGGFFVLSLVH